MNFDDIKCKIIHKDEAFVEVDLIGKRIVKCLYCKGEVEITPRLISKEELSHMKNVEKLYEKMRGMGLPLIINFRQITCPVCGKTFIGKDKFTKKIY